jgi:hypothetical protein
MASIVRENTKPELAVRRILWQLGARYRLHAKDLQAGCSHAGAAQNRLGAWVFLALAWQLRARPHASVSARILADKAYEEQKPGSAPA